jgi:hypothetical protein
VAGLSQIAGSPLRPLIDAALLRGESPASIATQTGLPRSSVYRYARGRYSPLQLRWVTETSVGQAAVDLSEVRSKLLRRFHEAAGRGTDVTVARLAREIANVTSALKRDFDVDPDNDEGPADYGQQIATLLGLLLFERPDLFALARTYDLSTHLLADLAAVEARMAELKKENSDEPR